MKKYLSIFFVATLVIVGGTKFFGNTNVTYAVSYDCVPGAGGDSWCQLHGYGNSCSNFDSTCANNSMVGNNTGGVGPSISVPCGGGINGVEVGSCYLGSLCANTGQASGEGVFIDPPNSCGIIAGGGSVGNVSTFVTGLEPVITWTTVTGAASYDLQVSTSPTFDTLVINKSVVGNSYRVMPLGNAIVGTPSTLKVNTKYYFRVKANNFFGSSPWSNLFSFTTAVNPSKASPLINSVTTPPPFNPCDYNPLGAGCPGFQPSITQSQLVSSIVSVGGHWVNKSAKTVTPTVIVSSVSYIDQNGFAIRPANSIAQKVAGAIDTLVGFNIIGNSSGVGPSITVPCSTAANCASSQFCYAPTDGSTQNGFSSWCVGSAVGTASATQVQ